VTGRWPTIALALSLAGGLRATAEDHSPPPWRGQPLTTFQHWDFSKPPALDPPGPDSAPQAPDRSQNPFAKGVADLRVIVRGVLPPQVEWLPAFFGAQGLWRLERVTIAWAPVFGYLEFVIKNAAQPAHTKEVRVQITSHEVSGAPRIFMMKGVPPPGRYERVDIEQEGPAVPLAGGLTHRVFVSQYKDCPQDEFFVVKPPEGGVIYVDQVVVDTICRPGRLEKLEPVH
jgi:hypothetical protein